MTALQHDINWLTMQMWIWDHPIPKKIYVNVYLPNSVSNKPIRDNSKALRSYQIHTVAIEEYWCTDEWGRYYDTSTIYKTTDIYALNCLRSIIEGKDPLHNAILYLHHEHRAIKEIARVIIQYGPKRIIFRKYGQPIYICLRGRIKNFFNKLLALSHLPLL